MEKECGLFVELKSDMGIDVQMQYPLLGMCNCEERCFVRREVMEMLLKAQALLPEGIYLRVWDAWRPFALQQELYEVYTEKIVEEFRLQKASEEERAAVIGEYLAVPNPDRKHPPCHTTGGAVDVTLIDTLGRELNMGTEFDSFSLKAHAEYYEQCGEDRIGACNKEICNTDIDVMEIRENRRILRNAMTQAGFAGLDSEWWHFGYGEKNWAISVGEAPFYEGAFTAEEVHRLMVNEGKPGGSIQ